MTGFGKRPDLTPSHHVLFDTGIGPRGPRIIERRTSPLSGKVQSDMNQLRRLKDEADLGEAVEALAEFGYDNPNSEFSPCL